MITPKQYFNLQSLTQSKNISWKYKKISHPLLSKVNSIENVIKNCVVNVKFYMVYYVQFSCKVVIVITKIKICFLKNLSFRAKLTLF